MRVDVFVHSQYRFSVLEVYFLFEHFFLFFLFYSIVFHVILFGIGKGERSVGHE